MLGVEPAAEPKPAAPASVGHDERIEQLQGMESRPGDRVTLPERVARRRRPVLLALLAVLAILAALVWWLVG